ncbi:cGMP-dependent protein kinase 1-like [Petromyzon marinus]|uniref:cGMP-dependent protein kinase 1-like n=1 Tax=Petromyzon marinus TaxID=7757 RepID=UPI003F726A57
MQAEWDEALDSPARGCCPRFCLEDGTGGNFPSAKEAAEEEDEEGKETLKEVQMGAIPKLKLSDFSVVRTLGVGTYGHVELVQLKNTGTQYFAMKIVKKQEIKKNSHEEYIHLEKEIMHHSLSNFIVKLYCTFQDMECLYLLMEAGLGGELWDILQERGRFDEQTARFYMACVLEALSYLHSEGIVYRDLKPENIVLDHKGYAKLIDFGFSKRLLFGERTFTLCGTPEYMAPEVILGEGHDVSADYWSLGVLIYELLTGSPLFKSEDTVRTYSLILQGISFAMLQGKVSNRAENLIRSLCRVDPLQRLGSQGDGLEAVRTHRSRALLHCLYHLH